MYHIFAPPCKSSIELIDVFYPQTSPVVYLISAVVFGATLWVIGKEDIRNEFQINKESAWTTIVISALITVIIIGVI